ncbi:MAG: hypothetical protein WA957_10385, partial [Alteraurantiacibacter sp.]
MSLTLAMHGSRIAHDAGVDATVRQRKSGLLGGARESGHHLGSVGFFRFLSCQVQETIGDDDGPCRPGEHLA